MYPHLVQLEDLARQQAREAEHRRLLADVRRELHDGTRRRVRVRPRLGPA